MKKTYRSTLLGHMKMILCFLILCVSCKKNSKENSSTLSCKIITALGGPDTYHFTYGTSGKLSSLHIAPIKQKITYSYEGDTTNVLVESDGNFLAKFIITNNSQGFATNIRRLANEAGTVWNNQSVEYNGTQVVKILYTSSNPNSPVLSVKYTWKNGNISTQESGNSVIHFEYYTDKPAVAGEWRRYDELIAGYRLYDNKNCTKLMKNAGEVTSFIYDFDADGRIVKKTVIEPGNAESSVEYEYSCN